MYDQWTESHSLAAVLLGLATLTIVLIRARKPALDLPRFEVTSDVVKTIEEAHEQV
jgi:NADH:ubiquinone oxidoreductase subunit B-like Fe-S oxidoreductase